MAESTSLAPRHGTGMLRRFGFFFRLLGFGRLLARVQFEEHSVDRVRTAAARGPVVYVLQHASAVDHLALNVVLNRRRLPLSLWSNGANSFWWQPVAPAWRDLWARLRGVHDDPVTSGWLAAQVRAGHVVTLFLQGRAWWGSRADPLRALVDAQRGFDRPIQVIPVVVQWSRAPALQGAVRNFLLGRGAAPGPLGQLRNVWFNSEGTVVQAGEPLDLAEFVRRADADRSADVLRTLLRRYLQRESQIIQGPRILDYQTMRRLVLDSPAMRRLAEREAAAQGAPVASIRRKMEAEYKLIAARFRWWVVRVSDVALRPIWTRIYSGVDVRSEDIERIRHAMRSGSAVIVPSHKSHFDYLLLSWVFYRHNLIVPHVIAGANLNIFLVNHFLRSVGGLFIKRSFQGERLHPAIFARYLRELVYQGYPIEFYIEGGRTRSGKLLPPKTGVLAILFEAAELRPHDHEVTLLPVSLAYEQVAEQGAYVREAEGEEKRPETVGQLVKARGVLSRRFGRVYLRVGEAVRASEWVDPDPDRPYWTQRAEADRLEALQRVGRTVMHRIGRVTVVLPTCLCAAALLAHPRRGVRQRQLFERVARFRALLTAQGAMEATSMERFEQAVRTALDRFARDGHIEAHELDSERVWSVQPGSRIELGFYKNQLIHFFVPAGLVALALRCRADGPFTADDLRDTAGWLVSLWEREFPFDPAQSVASLVDDGVAMLTAHGAVEPTGDGALRVASAERVGELHGLFRELVEAYRVVLAGRDRLRDEDTRAYVKLLVADGERFLAGGVATRPEALSTITLAEAVRGLTEAGCFTRDGRALRAVPEACAQVDARLAAMVG